MTGQPLLPKTSHATADRTDALPARSGRRRCVPAPQRRQVDPAWPQPGDRGVPYAIGMSCSAGGPAVTLGRSNLQPAAPLAGGNSARSISGSATPVYPHTGVVGHRTARPAAGSPRLVAERRIACAVGTCAMARPRQNFCSGPAAVRIACSPVTKTAPGEANGSGCPGMQWELLARRRLLRSRAVARPR